MIQTGVRQVKFATRAPTKIVHIVMRINVYYVTYFPKTIPLKCSSYTTHVWMFVQIFFTRIKMCPDCVLKMRHTEIPLNQTLLGLSCLIHIPDRNKTVANKNRIQVYLAL